MTGEAKHTKGEWSMRETAHVNGGREWFGYKYQCIEQPRLSRFDRYTRKDRSCASTWRVDGQDFASFQAAIEELDYPPRLSVAELNAIALFDKSVMAKSDFPSFQDQYEHLRALADKGIVWWDAGKASLLVDAAADAISFAESNASGKLEWGAVSKAVLAARAAISLATGDEGGR